MKKENKAKIVLWVHDNFYVKILKKNITGRENYKATLLRNKSQNNYV